MTKIESKVRKLPLSTLSVSLKTGVLPGGCLKRPKESKTAHAQRNYMI